LIRAYLRHWLSARDEHSLHSPFVYSLYTQVIEPDNPGEPAFAPIEALRQELLTRPDTITVTDYGAGSRRGGGRERKVRDMVRSAQKPPRLARLLYRLIRSLPREQPAVLAELGTSLGLTTLYQAAAAPKARLYTFEGCPQTAALARQHFDRLSPGRIDLVVGNLDQTLAETVQRLDRLDYVFFDANHRYEPTLRYFETCLPLAHNDSCFVFDDIHWSEEMSRAWKAIQAHPAAVVTIDLFYVGLVFFRQQQPKQHFVLRF